MAFRHSPLPLYPNVTVPSSTDLVRSLSSPGLSNEAARDANSEAARDANNEAARDANNEARFFVYPTVSDNKVTMLESSDTSSHDVTNSVYNEFIEQKQDEGWRYGSKHGTSPKQGMLLKDLANISNNRVTSIPNKRHQRNRSISEPDLFTKDIFNNNSKDVFNNNSKDIFNNNSKDIYDNNFKDTYNNNSKDIYDNNFKDIYGNNFSDSLTGIPLSEKYSIAPMSVPSTSQLLHSPCQDQSFYPQSKLYEANPTEDLPLFSSADWAQSYRENLNQEPCLFSPSEHTPLIEQDSDNDVSQETNGCKQDGSTYHQIDTSSSHKCVSSHHNNVLTTSRSSVSTPEKCVSSSPAQCTSGLLDSFSTLLSETTVQREFSRFTQNNRKYVVFPY